MATKVGDAFVDLSVHDHRFNAKMGAAKASVQGFGSSIKGVVAGLGGLFLARGLWTQFKTGVGEVARAEMELTKLEAVLESTGYKAGFTTAEIGALADQLERTAGISTEDTLAAASALATFVEIGSTEFKALIPVMQDMSKVMSTDMKGAALQLGKAFQEPTRAMTALRRSGVSFTESQVDMIKKLEASGRLVDAQRIMLRLLKEQGFDGVADAIGGTFAGQIDRAALGFGHLREQTVKMLGALFGIEGGLGSLADMFFKWGDAVEASIRTVKVWRLQVVQEWTEMFLAAEGIWDSLLIVFQVGWDKIMGVFGKGEGLEFGKELLAEWDQTGEAILDSRKQTQAQIDALFQTEKKDSKKRADGIIEDEAAIKAARIDAIGGFADIIKAAQKWADEEDKAAQKRKDAAEVGRAADPESTGLADPNSYRSPVADAVRANRNAAESGDKWINEMLKELKEINAKTHPQLPAFAGA